MAPSTPTNISVTIGTRFTFSFNELRSVDRRSGSIARIPLLSHETLAEMVGTTRSRITHFMNTFRTMGLIDYNGELIVRTELLTDVVLHD
jgi:hypothetical protein